MKNSVSSSEMSYQDSCKSSSFSFDEFDLFWQVKSLRAMSVNYP